LWNRDCCRAAPRQPKSRNTYNSPMLIEGVYAALTTPFYPDERIYFRKIEANMAHYSRSLLAGMVVLGSTGEAVMLTDVESRDVLRVSAEAAAPEKVLVAGVGRESVGATVALAETAAELKYDAVLVRPPSYYAGQLTTAAILHYFHSVADRSPLPVLLYNIPKCVPYQIPVEVIAELAEHSNVIGIKDSSGSVERIKATVEATRNARKRTVTVTPVFEAVTRRMLEQPQEPEDAIGSFVNVAELASAGSAGAGNSGAMVAAAPKTKTQMKTRTREVGFQVLCGSGSAVFDSLEAGACGAILAFAACAPQACQEIYLAWKDHDLKLAAEKQRRIAAANNRIVGGLGIAGVKYACDFNGFYGGRARAPLLPLTAAEKTEVESLLEEIRN
jgi:4-hydroxy-2-oxoglutarate aldolase